MRKRSKLMVFVAFVILVGLTGCVSKASLVIPNDKYAANYEKMFDAALKMGIKLGYKPTYQDKKEGTLTMERAVDFTTTQTISIQFGDVQGGKGFDITGRSSDNPMFVKDETNQIKNAILQAAGVPLEK